MLPPLAGRRLGRRLRMVDNGGECAVMQGGMPVYIFDRSDRVAEAATMASLSRCDLATDIEIAEAFGFHRNTVARRAVKLKAQGLSALVPAKPGPKGPHKLTPAVVRVIRDNTELGPRALGDMVAQVTGVRLSMSYLHAFRARERARQEPVVEQMNLDSGAPFTAETFEPEVLVESADAPVEAGEPVEPENAAAVAWDPPAGVPTLVRGQYMGLTLHFPALAALGLVDAARSVFGLPRSLSFGVRAVMLTLYFLGGLGKTTVETAKHLRRTEFGALVGTDRAPSVKTLRRKLAELVQQAGSSEFGQLLSRRWVEGGAVASAYLYVDGHMKVYSGKRKLGEAWNPQRRMPLPGLMTYFVGDQQGRPLLFITEEANHNMIATMPRVVAAIRESLGTRPFTIIFDRGGYNGALFQWLKAEGIPFITYQRGNPSLARDRFARREARFEGGRIRYRIAEDEVKVAKTGPWRRIVVLTKDGHQTPIVTSLGEDVPAARIACLMFARWRQENFFRYMRQHQGIDALTSYAYQDAPDSMSVPNPERKRLAKIILAHRKELAALRQKLGGALLQEPRNGRTAHGLKTAQKGAVGRVRELEAKLVEFKAESAALPQHVPVKDTGKLRHQMRLEQKTIIDRVKITAYNAEEWLLSILVRHYDNADDVRDLLRSFAALSGEMRRTPSGLLITLDPPDTPKHARALKGLCDDLNVLGVTYPGTEFPVIYNVAVHQKRAAA